MTKEIICVIMCLDIRLWDNYICYKRIKILQDKGLDFFGDNYVYCKGKYI